VKRKAEGRASAVIVAAGRGTRMNMEMNKQYLEIGGVPMLARTLALFENCAEVDQVVLVVNAQEVVYCKGSLHRCRGEFTPGIGIQRFKGAGRQMRHRSDP